ncbi:uncharacterized protein LOC144175896 [Haemaphysalis longicornis]
MRYYTRRVALLAIATAAVFALLFLVKRSIRTDRLSASARNWWAGDIVDFGSADNVTGFKHVIVPNVVHFVRLGNASLTFVEAVCIRAAWIQQRPVSLVVHCDSCDESTRSSPHWPLVSAIPGLRLETIKRPRYVFGKRLSSIYHASDIARLRILRKYGGIFLDGDSYLVRSLDPFRHFEMALGWYPNQALGTQVLVAHKNARFLKLWYNSYRYYRAELWYWNAGRLPTEMILVPHPHLVHRVPYDFGVHNVAHLLYGVCKPDWRRYFAIHLLFRHREYLVASDTFGPLTVSSVGRYNRTFGQMARLALFGTTRMGSGTVRDPGWFLENELEYVTDVC